MPVEKLTRTEVRQRQTRVRLREVAYRLMSDQGVDATSIQQITDGANVGFGTFYNYYSSKEALAREVLDCIIHNLGERNDLITLTVGETDPVRIVANSCRFVLKVMMTDPVFGWWVASLDLLAERIRVGFAPFGIRDIDVAVEAGAYRIIDGDRRLAWSQLAWLVAAGGRDLVRGIHGPEAERAIVEGILRVMGASHEHARRATDGDAPVAPPLDIDFGFETSAVDAADF